MENKNFVVVEGSTDIEVEQMGLTNIAFIDNCSSTTLIQSTNNVTGETGDELYNIVRDVMDTLLDEVERNVFINEEQNTYHMTEETDAVPDVESVLEEIGSRPLMNEEIIDEPHINNMTEETDVVPDVERVLEETDSRPLMSQEIIDEPHIRTRSMTRRAVSKDTQTDTNSSSLVIPSQSARYNITLTALREIENNAKMDVTALDEYIKEKLRYNVPNLRKMLNEGIKNGIVEKSIGCQGRVVYKIKEKTTLDKKQDVPSTLTDEETSQIDLTYKKTDKEAFFSVSQTRKPSTSKNQSDKSLVLQALTQFRNTGVSAVKIKNIVNKTKPITLKRVRDLLDICVQENKVQMLRKGKIIIFKLI